MATGISSFRPTAAWVLRVQVDLNSTGNGNLVSSDGFKVMGYMAVNGTIDNTGAVTTIEINKGQLIPANPTTTMSIAANLDAQAANGDTYSSAVQIYDSLGQSHTCQTGFQQDSDWRHGAGLQAFPPRIPVEPSVILTS